MRFRASYVATLAAAVMVAMCASCSGPKQNVADLTEVVANPATFEGMDVTVRGLVSKPDETESKDGEKATFVLVPPSSPLGMAVMGTNPPDFGKYAEATGTVEIDPQLNAPYMNRPAVRRVSELPMWQRPFDRQTLAAIAALCSAALAIVVFAVGRRYGARGIEPSQDAFRAALASILVPAAEQTPPASEPAPTAEPPPEVVVEMPAPAVPDPLPAAPTAAEPPAPAEEPGPARVEAPPAPQPDATEPGPPATTEEPPLPQPPAAAGGLVVEVRGGVDAGRCFALDRSLLTIGRHPDRDVILTDPVLGEWDATIVHAGGTLRVRSEGERAILCVNGQPIAESAIGPDDVIRIGSSELVIRRSGEASSESVGGTEWLQR